MAKTRNFDHPDGPNNVVSIVNTRRGRWRCQDVVENEPVYSSTSGTCIDRPREDIVARNVTTPAVEELPQHRHSGRHAGKEAQEQHEKTGMCAVTQKPDPNQAEASRATDNNPTTSDLTLDLDLKKNLELPGSLDTNTNASPRKTTSATVITNHSTASDTGAPEEPGDSVIRTELLTVTLVVCIVLLPCLLPFWSVSGDSWNILHILWRMVFQAIAVAFSTGLVLLGLQVHFPSYQLRLWVARVFHLEIEEETTPQTGPVEKLHQTEKKEVDGPPHQIGDGDKKSDVLSSGERRVDEPQKAGTNDIARQTTDAQDSAPESGRTSSAQNVSEVKEEIIEITDTTVQTTDPGKRHKQALKRFHRKFLHIRRKYKSEMWKLKRTDHEASEVLSRVQLALPALEREKQALLAELEAIHKQHQEEKRRNQDLITRLHRLNQQFMRVGAPPQASTTSSSSIAVGQPTTDQPHHHHHQHYDSQRPPPQPYHHPPQQQQQLQQLPQQHHHHQQRELQQNQHHQQQHQFQQQQQQQPQQQQQQGRIPATGQKDVGMETKTDAVVSGSAGRSAPRNTACGASALSYSVALCSQPASAQVSLRPFQQQPK